MPRPAARRPVPLVLPNSPMDILWEVDENSDDLPHPSPSSSAWFSPPRSSGPLRSIFEDDDDEEDIRDVSFPLPPVSLPAPTKRLFSIPRMSLPIHPAPRKSSPAKERPTTARKSSLYSSRSAPVPFPRERAPSPYSALHLTPPRRQRLDVQRPVSPTSSASGSDTEPPRTPPAAPASLPEPAISRKPYVHAPPPPAEWESAIDALFACEDDEDVVSIPPAKVYAVPIPTRRPPPPPVESYLSFSPPLGSPISSPRQSNPLSPTQLPMSPTFSRALGSPGFMPMSPGSSDLDHSSWTSARPSTWQLEAQRSSIPIELLFRS